MKILKKILILLALFSSSFLSAQEAKTAKQEIKFYAGYDLGEMAFNKFQNFAGEVGLKFKNDHTLRFTYMNVQLTEKHLASGFASAVDGGNITGHWKGYDLIYDIPVYRFKKSNMLIYGGLSAGYHTNTYQHITNEESFNHQTKTIGLGIGLRETNLFKIKGLYANFHLPIRYYFNTLDEINLGNSTVKKIKLEQTLHFFIGYEF